MLLIFRFFFLGFVGHPRLIEKSCTVQSIPNHLRFFRGDVHLQRNFFQRSIAAQFSQQTLIHTAIVLDSLAHFLADTIGASLERDGLGHILADIPVTACLKIILLMVHNGLPSTETALLDQIQQQYTVAHMRLCEVNHPAQGQIQQLLLGAGLFGSGILRKDRHITASRKICQFLQIQPQRIILIQRGHQGSLVDQLLFPTQTQGGIAGCCYELSSVTGCYSEGTISFQRLGRYASSFEMAVGGIVGKLESGMVNNCASGLDITVVESAGTTTGGIVGWLNVNGKVSNVAYYGTIHVEASSEGWFGGLAGRVSGWLTKGYFQGQIQSGGNRYADIVGRIDASGSVSKTVGYGNTSLIYGENNGSSIYNYVIGVDYGVEILYSREMLFDTLGLYEADFWGIDEERGLYLITFLGR